MARPTDGLLDGYEPSLVLDRYQEIMQLPIAAFNGLNWPEEDPKTECSTIWKQDDRNNLAMWISASEERREQELGYHLAPKWLLEEEHDYTKTLVLDRKLLIKIGVPVITVTNPSVALTLRDGLSEIIDPVIVTADLGVSVSTDEIVVFYEGEEVEFLPSNKSISGTVATISIPRSRLVKPELMDNREDHLYYIDDVNFVEAVDVGVRQIINEGSVKFVWSSAQVYCGDGCAEKTQNGCYTTLGHRAKRISKTQVWPATFTDDIPKSNYFTYPVTPYAVRISYLSGKQSSMNTQLLTARLAHTMMPNAPCSCPYVEQYWEYDREITEYNSGYGSMRGAIDAWTADFRSRIGAGGMFSA